MIMRLADGSTVISPRNNNPIQMPSDVSIEDNVRFGEFISTFPPNERKEAMLSLFVHYFGEMDYQRNHSVTFPFINPAYISFGNFNYGAVAAAAGFSLKDALFYAALGNHLGDGEADAAYGGSLKNELMIRAGWEAYHADNIPHDSRNGKEN